jgi:hypothetical protein
MTTMPRHCRCLLLLLLLLRRVMEASCRPVFWLHRGYLLPEPNAFHLSVYRFEHRVRPFSLAAE